MPEDHQPQLRRNVSAILNYTVPLTALSYVVLLFATIVAALISDMTYKPSPILLGTACLLCIPSLFTQFLLGVLSQEIGGVHARLTLNTIDSQTEIVPTPPPKSKAMTLAIEALENKRSYLAEQQATIDYLLQGIHRSVDHRRSPKSYTPPAARAERPSGTTE